MPITFNCLIPVLNLVKVKCVKSRETWSPLNTRLTLFNSSRMKLTTSESLWTDLRPRVNEGRINFLNKYVALWYDCCIVRRNFMKLILLQGLTFFLAYSIFSAVLGMLQFGYNTGVINAPEQVNKSINNYHFASTIVWPEWKSVVCVHNVTCCWYFHNY